MARRIVHVEPGLLRIEQRLRIPGLEIGTDVSGPACIYAIVLVRRGTVTYQHGESRIRAPRSFALFLPPFGIVQASLERCDVTSVAVAFRPLASDELPRQAVLLAGGGPAPRSRIDALERIRTAATATHIGRDRDPARLVAHAKAIIDQEYGAPLEIRRIAARLHASPAVLSRAFRHTCGMPPVRYRHHVRIMDALMQFAEGAAPAQVFQDVGFDDLSRFYKIFRKVTCAPPGSYRPARSRIAKT
jgi:AraC-like DNA-binding protein